MTFARKLIISFFFTGFFTFNIAANDNDRKIPQLITPDTTSIYRSLLNDESDDLMEYHPADDIYNNIWTSTKLNPYKICIDSLPDSVRIDLSSYCVPVPGAITSDFGPRRYRYHYGTDLRLNVGDSVVASFAGKVRIIDYDHRGYGHYVVIRHDNGLETVYAHLSVALVCLDQRVEAGELIALGGNTGRSTGPHLHYEIRFLGNAMNPARLIDFTQGHPFENEYLITRKNSFYYQKEIKAMKAIKYYRVRKGDNLGRIASRNGTSIKALCRMNRISPKKILKVGQSIRIR
jgi:murein DD-endopeptidase MepM/ murein hydrolase activator NlpD